MLTGELSGTTTNYHAMGLWLKHRGAPKEQRRDWTYSLATTPLISGSDNSSSYYDMDDEVNSNILGTELSIGHRLTTHNPALCIATA